MEKKGRSFTKIKKSMPAKKFKSFCIEIAEKYANSNEEFARSYFMKEYNISASCFYKILETAIVCNWVSDETVRKMEAKALKNQKAHAVEAGLTTRKHYAEMRQKRQDYILSFYTEKEIENLAVNFAYSPVSKKEFAEAEEMSVGMLDKLLKKAIVELIVDDVIFNAIRQRSIDNTPQNQQEKVKDFFIKLAKERYSKISELLSE